MSRYCITHQTDSKTCCKIDRFTRIPVVKEGSTLELVLQDVWGRVYYTEPFTYQEYWGRALDDTFSAFRDGVSDALRGIKRDIEHIENIKTVPTDILERELERRKTTPR